MSLHKGSSAQIMHSAPVPMAGDGPDGKRHNRGFLGYDSSALSPRDRQDRQQLRYEIDLNGWMGRIWMVTASGFLTDSYNLFSTNVIISTISFVYSPNDSWLCTVINIATLFGSVVGQLLFGYLADRYGRTRLYGIELVLVIISTLGVATSSHGYGDLSFVALFTWWRFVMGVGIGAEYPLSAVITTEWSSTISRTTMISSVFLMQPVGQALAQIVAVWVLMGQDAIHGIQDKQCGLNTLHDVECKKIVDNTWRIVIGSGAIPAVLAIMFRFFLYDCGLYTLEVRNKPDAAFRDTQRVYGTPPISDGGDSLGSPAGAMLYLHEPTPVQFSMQDFHNYFVRDKNWYYLAGTATTWFFLDISFYGFSLDNRRTLADMWATTKPTQLNASLSCWESSLPGGNSTVPSWATTGLPSWQTDPTQPCNTIYQMLLGQARQYLLTVSIASIAGSTCFIFAANRIHRRSWLIASFLFMTGLFGITGGVYYGVAHTPGAPATVVLVAICCFVFNFGANTLTFIIPAEIFATSYRCTCHGISAAAGKMGSIIAQLVFYAINSGYTNDKKQGLCFILFGSFMFLGAICAWVFLPDVQREVVHEFLSSDGQRVGQVRRLENKTLEELGEGRERARLEGQATTMLEKLGDLRKRGTRPSGSIASVGGP